MGNYFIGLTLPEGLRGTIESERLWMREKWGNRSGMRTEPHITVIPPFESDMLLSLLKEILSSLDVPPFSVNVSGYGSFGERTIYAHVKRSLELETLVRKATKILGENEIKVKKEKRYTPHVTIANRDIKPYSFIPSMEYLNKIDINETFMVDSFMIFEFRNYSWVMDESNRVKFSH